MRLVDKLNVLLCEATQTHVKRDVKWHTAHIPGFWVSPEGLIIQLSDSDLHTEYVQDNPETFFDNLEYDDNGNDVYYKNRDRAREDAIRNGWIAIRPWSAVNQPNSSGEWFVSCGVFRPSRPALEKVSDVIVAKWPESAGWPVVITPAFDRRYTSPIRNMTWKKINAGYLRTVEPSFGESLVSIIGKKLKDIKR